jgi:hypothetical protein
MSGWIKLHRQLIEWEWYSDINTTRLFLHLVLIANHKDNVWRNIPIKRGQKLTSLIKLSEQTGLTIQKVRTALTNLKSTNDITSLSSSQHTVFTVVNYDLYQGETSETTNEQQTENKQITTNKNVKNEKNLSKVDSFDYLAVIDTFNRVMVRSPNVSKLNEKRKRSVRNLFKFAGFDLVKFEGYLNHMHSSKSWDWCFRVSTGTNGINYRKKSFDYFMKEDTFLTASEEVNDNEQ